MRSSIEYTASSFTGGAPTGATVELTIGHIDAFEQLENDRR
jgi:hypothetical protein